MFDPHPDPERMTSDELHYAIAEADEKMRLAREAKDAGLEVWFIQDRRMLVAELARRNGQHSGFDSFPSPRSEIGKGTNFNPLSASELLSTQIPQIPYVLSGYIAKGVLALLVAYMKTGKSTLVYRLIVCIAQGIDFLERKTERGGVLILACEEHPRDVERRLRRFGMTPDDPIYVHIGPVRDHADALKSIKDFIAEKKIILVVIDSLARFWAVQDENNNSEVVREVSPLLDLARETNAAVLLIHHERKSGGEDGRNIRGGSALFGLVDQAIFLERRPGELSSKRILKTLGRYEESPPELIIDLVGDDYRVLGTPEEFSEARSEQKIKAVLTIDPADIRTVSKRADATEKVTRKILEVLKERGEIERSGAGKKNDPYLYYLLINGDSLLAEHQPIRKGTISEWEPIA